MRLVPADLPERVARFLHRYSTPDGPLRLGVAVSGGADSVVLLHLLTRFVKGRGGECIAVHVNHKLRGEESDADERFVRELAQSLGWSAEILIGPPGPGNLEAEARLVRLRFFGQVRATRELSFIATGHTASDQAETVLFRFLRGSGLAGLAGMAPLNSDHILRPLLGETREAIREYAEANSIAWREDASNSNLGFRRNRLRRVIIPELTRHFNQRLESTLAANAEVARDEEDFWSVQTASTLKHVQLAQRAPGMYLDVATLALEHRAVQRRVLRLAIRNVRGNLLGIDLKHVDSVLVLLESREGHDRVQIPHLDALRSFDVLRLARPGTADQARGYSIVPLLNAPTALPGTLGQVSLGALDAASSNCVTVKGENLFSVEEAELDAEAVRSVGGVSHLRFRNWEPGDAILLSLSGTPIKLKTLFQEHRVLLWERRHWLVLASDERILWARHFGAAAGFAASEKSRERLLLRFIAGGAAGCDL